jgi:hypothetical protein
MVISVAGGERPGRQEGRASTFCRRNNLSLEELGVCQRKEEYLEYDADENNG